VLSAQEKSTKPVQTTNPPIVLFVAKIVYFLNITKQIKFFLQTALFYLHQGDV
jgi:hypothetical protein